MASVLLGFNSCVTSISRLYSRPELVTGVLGAKMTDLLEATPLAELVIAGDLEELVSDLLVYVWLIYMWRSGVDLNLTIQWCIMAVTVMKSDESKGLMCWVYMVARLCRLVVTDWLISFFNLRCVANITQQSESGCQCHQRCGRRRSMYKAQC